MRLSALAVLTTLVLSGSLAHAHPRRGLGPVRGVRGAPFARVYAPRPAAVALRPDARPVATTNPGKVKLLVDRWLRSFGDRDRLVLHVDVTAHGSEAAAVQKFADAIRRRQSFLGADHAPTLTITGMSATPRVGDTIVLTFDDGAPARPTR
jgi:hypothetical protein